MSPSQYQSKTRIQSNLLNDLEYSKHKTSKFFEPVSEYSNVLTCEACKLGLAPLDAVLTYSVTQGLLETVAVEACRLFKIDGGVPSVCKGAVHEMATFLLPSLANGVLSSNRVCDEMLHLCSSPVIKELDENKYVQDMLSSKPKNI